MGDELVLVRSVARERNLIAPIFRQVRSRGSTFALTPVGSHPRELGQYIRPFCTTAFLVS